MGAELRSTFPRVGSETSGSLLERRFPRETPRFAGARQRSPGRAGPRLLQKKLENPGKKSRHVSEGSCRTKKLISKSPEGRAIPDLRGSSMFPTESSPCCHHHPAEPLFLFHVVTASTLSRKVSRARRGRRRSRHNSGVVWRSQASDQDKKSSPLPSGPLPLTNMAAAGPATQVNTRNCPLPPSFARPEETDGGGRGPNLPRAFPPFLFPRLLSGSRAPNSNFSRTRTPLGWFRGLGLLDFSAFWQGPRSNMTQVLFQEPVPLQVKCKDCEER